MASYARTIPPPAYAAAIESITTIYRSLPPRPSLEEIEAANSVLDSVQTEQNHQLDLISTQLQADVPPEFFSVMQEVKRTMVMFRSHEQRREAEYLVELDRFFQVFDQLIQKASDFVSADGYGQETRGFKTDDEIQTVTVISDVEQSGEGSNLKSLLPQTTSKPLVALPSGDEKLNLMKVAAVIERSAKEGESVLDFRGKLTDKVEWLPYSLGKLATLTELYISENQIMALPTSIGNLHALKKLDARANQLINLPATFGELQNLTDLDLSANRLKTLPESFGDLGKLTDLDLSSNRFSKLPNVVGNLVSLQRLNVETNDLEELPHAIGSCSSLLELRLDFNQLRALPEAIGELELLEILTLHYNRVKRLPTTMGNLLRLREFDISFNELESITETLCSAVSLEKLNVGKNFADLRMLPESLGNLEKLQELDISHNQIKVLPDSFGLLSRLRTFRSDQNPLDIPPRHVVKLGAQAVVQYMSDLVAGRNVNSLQGNTKRGLCAYICSIFCFGIESG